MEEYTYSYRPSNLKVLDLRGLSLKTIPNEIWDLPDIEYLNLSENKLVTIPKDILKFKNLKKLLIHNNEIEELPKELGLLSSLEELSLTNNRLESIPKSICNLPNLIWLYIGGNKLVKIPKEIGNLSNLITLSVWGNLIEKIPETLGNLVNLRRLDLSNNLLEIIPDSLRKLSLLESNSGKEIWERGLQLQNNNFGVSDELFEKDPHEIIDYLIELEKGKKELNEVKIILVGHGKVGKTSIVNRLIFDKFNREQNQTDGILIENWKIDTDRRNESIVARIWDFGGQHIMHSIHRFFLTRRTLYLLVVESRTEENQGITPLHYWMKQIESISDDSPIIVIQNKYEGDRKFQLPQRTLSSSYPQIVDFVNTSCLTGYGIDELESKIVYHASNMPHLNDKIPESFFKVKDQLLNTKRNFINFEAFKAICNRIDKNLSSNLINVYAKLLHDIGAIIHIKSKRYIPESHVLNPSWIVNGVYQIITSPILNKNKGIITFDSIREILIRKENKGAYDDWIAGNIIVSLMKDFELCFPLPYPNDDSLLIASSLSVEPPEELSWNYENNLRFNIHYNFLPINIISNFIIRNLHQRVDELYWRYGIILNDAEQNNLALIQADLGSNKIYIKIAGNGDKKETLYYIRKNFNEIHKNYDIEKLKPEGFIPIDDEETIYIAYNRLKIMEEDNKEYDYVHELKLNVKVKDLLNGVDVKDKFDNDFFEKIEDLLPLGEIEEVFDVIFAYEPIKYSEYYNDFITLRATWNYINKNYTLGTIDFSEIKRETSKMVVSIISIIDNIKNIYRENRLKNIQ